ncbi:unnamed protein product [Symbiodinium pilosum]|uniref:Uncharacterized protein n=1 Tax=Symbiodinium pilosum TaxID=2952 RepID=A0A812WS30_SYMPI|nr:unnamed protein product [Symbiodinium pilosum]
MPWGGGGGSKNTLGGNPGRISRMAGDLPPDTSEGHKPASLNLTAVLMGRGARVASSQGINAHRAPMPGAPTSALSSLPTNWKMPDWIKPDAHICYNSRSTGEKVEVVVEMVNTAKQEVEVTGVSMPGFLRVIPFSVIASAMNPLFPPEALPKGEEDGDQVEGPEAEKEAVDLTRERSRSRSGKR